MKVKPLSLILLIIFLAVATSFVVGLPTSQVTERNVGFSGLCNIEQIDDKVNVKPCGDEMDGPECQPKN